ncbi:MAG: PAS domain-containing protein [Planctomycetes bacterium]|nr:PAS domain-containing protein [Planctomycetota bacterium]
MKKKKTRKSKGKRTFPMAEGKDGTSELETTAPEVSDESTNIASVPVVGVGASAGGLEAFTQLLNHLPPDTGFAFVLVQHLDPHHASVLPKILSAKTRMGVREAADGDVLKPNVVFVLPADKSITVSQGLLRLSPRLETGRWHHPIDAFLRSLAMDQKSRAIGVILSGSGSDGALGIQAVKDEGGINFVQDEKSSQHAGMPQSAIATGCVDFVLPPEGIARELARLGGHSYIVQQPVPAAAPAPPEDSLRQVFTLLRNMSGIDFSQYQQSTIQRRLRRRMALAQVENGDDYLAYVLRHKGELASLLSDFLIKTTQFFRDGATFEFLAQRVLPSIMKDRSAEEPLRVWVPACSTGEETYSLLICLMEWIEQIQSRVEVKMFASDVSESAISQARKGSYPENISQNVSAERLERFFTRNGLRYEVKPPLRKMCVFAKHDLLNAPPFSRMDLIGCRNLLIYLGRATQGRVLSILHYALKPGGVLLLGTSEGVNEAPHLFHQIDKRFKVFSKQPSSEHFRFRPAQEHLLAESPRVERGTTEVDPENAADRITMERYSPPGVLINEDMTILQFRGDVSRYIRPAAGKATLNLIGMLHEGLQLGLRSAVLKAKKQRGAVRKKGLQFVQKGRIQNLSVDVIPIPSSSSGERTFLIVFLEGGEAEVSKPGPHRVGRGGTGGESAESSALKRELAETKEYLKSVVEDLSINLEQLQATNEELESANEELQSTNEELETSKEEIEATNEELNTVNAELTDRNHEVMRFGDYLEAVFNTVRDPLLLLDPVLRVKQANRAFYELFRISENETVGRFVGELATERWAVTDWNQVGKFLVGQSDSENISLEIEVPSLGRRHMRVNARPVQLPHEGEPTILMALEDITSSQDLAREQRRLIRQLSAPVLPLQKQIVVLPIIGLLNAERMHQVREKLLEAVRQHRAKMVILDITGAAIEKEGKGVAEGFLDITKVSQLVGATVILTGISSEIAQELVSLNMDRSKLTSMGDLQSGLDEANRMLGCQVIANQDLETLREALRQAKRELDVLRKKQPAASALPPR